MTKPYRPDFERYLDDLKDFGRLGGDLPDASLIEFTEREGELVEAFEQVIEKIDKPYKQLVNRIERALQDFQDA